MTDNELTFLKELQGLRSMRTTEELYLQKVELLWGHAQQDIKHLKAENKALEARLVRCTSSMEALAKELELAEQERESLKADAVRYQWIRTNTKGFDICVWDKDEEGNYSYYSVTQTQVDAAINNARVAVAKATL